MNNYTVSYWGNDHASEWTRECVPNTDKKKCCAWCGQAKNRLYRYGNAKGTSFTKYVFCNLDCYKSYNY